MPNAAPHSPEETYDQWLVIRAQAGDAEAMRRLYGRWAAKLQRHALRLTGNADGAADASQEAWMAIVRGLDRLEDPACFRRWAYQIVGRKGTDWVRKRSRQRAITTSLIDDPATPEPPADTSEPIEALRHALRQLGEQDRTVLAMHYLDGMPLREMAEALGLPHGTVKSRLHYARQRLRDAIRIDQPPI